MKKKYHIILCVMLFFCTVLVYAGGNKDSDYEALQENKTEKTLSIALDWTTNTNHIGVFVAQEKGFFKQKNLQVEIIPFSETTVELLVGNNQVDFGFSYQEAFTFARAADNAVPIVALATVIQNNTSGFASLRKANIQSPKDFVGKKYGSFGSPIEKAIISTLISPYNISIDDVPFVPAGSMDFFVATERKIYDFAWIFQGWTGVEAEIRGQDLNFISLRDMNSAFNYYTPIIISSEKFINNNPDITRDFIIALQQGYEWTINNVDEATDILLENEPTLDRKLVHKSLLYLSSQFKGDATYWGHMRDEVWMQFTQWLQKNEFIPHDFDIKGTYTNDFLQ